MVSTSTSVELIIYALAAGAIVDVMSNGSIFARWRALLELRGGHWADLVACPFCFNHAAALGLAFLLYLPTLICPLLAASVAREMPGGLGLVVRVVLILAGYAAHALAFGLAVGRLGWLVNGLLPADLQYVAPKGPAPAAAIIVPKL